MRLDELSDRRVVLLGLGADVRAAITAIRGAGPAEIVVVEEGRVPAAFDLRTVPLEEAARWGEVFVRSPGFPRYQAPLLAALDRGARMTTPLDLWMGTIGPDRTVVAITGTKGKSTVSELVGVFAGQAGLRVGVAGNLGPAVFGSDWDRDAPVVVLEVSSYQAADLHHVPDVAAVTFLAEDHLSWHGGVVTYVTDKLRVLRNDGGTARRILVAEAGGRAEEAIAELGLAVEVVRSPAGDPTLPRHRIRNAALAAAVVTAVGGPTLDDEGILRGAATSLPGRLDVCDGPAGLLCVDDALASNPSATAAGLGWLRERGRPTIVLLGGADRGVDPAPLVDEVARWPRGLLRAVALPDTGADLAGRCGLEVVATVAEVEEGVARAVACSPPGGAVLFSPAAPTPTGSGNWETRSRAFRAGLAGPGPAGT